MKQRLKYFKKIRKFLNNILYKIKFIVFIIIGSYCVSFTLLTHYKNNELYVPRAYSDYVYGQIIIVHNHVSEVVDLIMNYMLSYSVTL